MWRKHAKEFNFKRKICGRICGSTRWQKIKLHEKSAAVEPHEGLKMKQNWWKFSGMNVADYFGNLMVSMKLLWHACHRIFVNEFLRHSCLKIVSVFDARWVSVADYFGNLLVSIKLLWHACRRIFVSEFLRHSCRKIVSVNGKKGSGVEHL